MNRWLSGLVLSSVFAVACSSSDDATTSSSSSSGSGACAPALGANSGKCPEMTVAEGAYDKMKSSCGLSDSELDISNPDSPTLVASAKPKACSSCDCRKAIYAYETVYQGCTGEDKGNTALAKNVYDLAAACK